MGAYPARNFAPVNDRIEEYRRDWIAGPAPQRPKRVWQRKKVRLGAAASLITVGLLLWGGGYLLHWKRLATQKFDAYWKGTQTQLEMNALCRELRRYRSVHETLPERPIEFIKTALQKNKISQPGCDFWGTPYRFTQDWQGFQLHSAGPNRIHEDSDDLQVDVRYEPARK